MNIFSEENQQYNDQLGVWKKVLESELNVVEVVFRPCIKNIFPEWSEV